MERFISARTIGVLLFFCPSLALAEPAFRVGFAERDITPDPKKRTVYLAGFGHNRQATGIHDRLTARAWVIQTDRQKLAFVSLDLIGFFLANVERVRNRLPNFDYVLVSSTHNHEGPDTLGLWGPNPFRSGVDASYLQMVEAQVAAAVLQAEKNLQTATARIGTVPLPHLIHDNREPYIKHDELVALEFFDSAQKRLGAVVQWNSHPETLGSRNTQISADFVGYTVKHLQHRLDVPVVYFTGTVGGLMTSLKTEIKDETGKLLADGTFAKTKRYGELVADAAEKALKNAKPIQLTPIRFRRAKVFIPIDNRLYLLGRQLKVLKRQAFVWTGNPEQAEPAKPADVEKRLCLQTELACLYLGELGIAAIPGEIYPELVLGKVQNPVDPGADFPDAEIEPAIYSQLRGKHRMLIGLANDEIGYIIPKRQWDAIPPYCYGRKKSQYGEINSVGPEAAPILCGAFRRIAQNLAKDQK
ncbi:MAG: hypothetical protein KatS3mg105_1420 [Gemmatales bacterium]|nr:MAG: hypothetical protein KatS3mg105_1420 [Gemmatales bacterium]